MLSVLSSGLFADAALLAFRFFAVSQSLLLVLQIVLASARSGARLAAGHQADGNILVLPTVSRSSLDRRPVQSASGWQWQRLPVFACAPRPIVPPSATLRPNNSFKPKPLRGSA
ncbi:hypothetical protein [Lysobacter sp. CFH 32150]|uniref:hypothetical protein n=1 Tax=Lysobacter sp. CFH 32150 TaxID=2927128 RepID=UPI001FA6C139|nr:hypothetical protein [Lysobacter sp. CFH 32150]MCI4569486.1 hypothetical protein [Lysobacter sp. CFH 32150]